MKKGIESLIDIAAKAEFLRLFLDYDGTLAVFAPTPDVVLPDSNVIELLERFVNSRKVKPAIISGRRLDHIRKLLPIKGLLLAGTYGMEMQLPDGEFRSLLAYEEVRPTLDVLLPVWQSLIEGLSGFYLEDKGWTLAVHGRYAEHPDPESIILQAKKEAITLGYDEIFHLVEGYLFIELAPRLANKPDAVKWIAMNIMPKNALSIYIGDDDVDELAFKPVIAAGGYAVRVSPDPIPTLAQFRLKNPAEVLDWLEELLKACGS